MEVVSAQKITATSHENNQREKESLRADYNRHIESAKQAKAKLMRLAAESVGLTIWEARHDAAQTQSENGQVQ